MKTKISYSLLAAAMACGIAQGQTTAYTTPVGYVTMNVAGGGTPSVPKSSYIGPSLPSSATFAGLSLGTGTGSTVNFSATPAAPFTVGQFGLNSLGESKFYAEVVSGPNAGIWSDIVSNTTTSITCGDAIAATFASQQVVIRQHHTLASLFTNSSLTLPFQGAASIANADELTLLDSISQVLTIYYFSTDDADEDGFQDGWVLANGTLASDKIISPTDGITVKRKAAGILAIAQSGEVKTTQTKLRIDQGLNILPVNRAVGNTLRLSPLTATAALGGRTGSNLLGSGLTSAASIANADELTVLTNGVASIYYFSTDDGDEDGQPDGWIRSDGTPSGDLVIPEGSGLRLRRKLASSFTWTVPAEPIDANPVVGISN